MTVAELRSIYNYFFFNQYYSEWFFLFVGFGLGIIFSPFVGGVPYFVLSLLLFEIIWLWGTKGIYPYWRLGFRLTYLAAAFFGYVFGVYATHRFTGSPIEEHQEAKEVIQLI